MPTKLLIDASYLYALNDKTDKYHLTARAFAASNWQAQVVPDVVLTEVTHLLKEFIGHHAIIRFLRIFTSSSFQVEAVTIQDIRRAHEIMIAYADARFDFVDCCIMALSERLKITQICTFDHRDFGIFRPTHCEFLELLP